jgi:2,4-dienoyl-CoA reductase-like NADH-dependent reductase (Old Yellow Enzyme family)
MADTHDRPTPALEELYRRWSEGGSGTLITGNVMVDRRYLERPGNVVIEDESALPELSRWAKAGTVAGNHFWIQISHPGRQCKRIVSSHPVAPSATQLHLLGNFGKPRALNEDEIIEIIRRYARAASIAKKAGFTGVQIHGAHGYLCNQFLSPRVNQRTDNWGGILQNRARFLREIVQATRHEVGPAFPISVKLNSSDFQQGGFTLEESCQVARWLVEDGIDLLEISGGTYEKLQMMGDGQKKMAEGTRKREAYFLEYAASIRAGLKVPLAVTGGFRSRSVMEEALSKGELDVIGVARPLCSEPDISSRLIARTAEAGRADEENLRLGRGWLGPTSENKGIRAANFLAMISWFYEQLLLIGSGKNPDFRITAWQSLIRNQTREIKLALARRRVSK